MAVDSQYGDSRPKSNPEHDWQSLGSIAARLVEGAKK